MDKDVVDHLLSDESLKETPSVCNSETFRSVSKALKRKIEPNSQFDEIKKRTLKSIITNGSRVDEKNGTEEEEMSLRDRLLEELQTAGNDSSRKHQVEPPSDPKDIYMQQVIEHEKKVIKMKSHLPNLALPEGWIAINHRSGGIVYLHRSSRVVTWSRPYHIGGASARKHDVPIAAIPCLHQLKGLLSDRDIPNQQLHQWDRNKTEQDNDTVHEEIDNPNLSSKREITVLNILNTVGTTDSDESNGETVRLFEQHDGDDEKCTHDKTEFISKITNSNSENDLDYGLDVAQRVKASISGNDNNSNSATSAELRNIKTQTSSQAIELIDYEELENYLSRLWEFQELTEEQEQNILNGQLTETKSEELELQPILDSLPYSIKGVDHSKSQGREWYLNAGSKTPVAILHEYSQQVMKLKPDYKCYEGDSSTAPFVAEVVIDGITYGKEQAPSKKQAKHSAAEATLEILVPGLLKKFRDYQISQDELETFDKVKIENPNVYDLCMKTGLPSPSNILDECLKRNQGVGPNNFQFGITPGTNQNHSYKMTCGKHTATGFCKNKKIGKQLAAQKILQKLHPRLEHWGSILRIYCDRPTVKSYKKEKEDSSLNTGGIPSGAKPELLLQLKNEMKKLSAAKKQENQEESEPKAVAYRDVITVDI